jgi:hypothetical protein
MRINAGTAWAGCDFSVVARPTIPSHSFMTSPQTMQTAPYAAPGALKFIDGLCRAWSREPCVGGERMQH